MSVDKNELISQVNELAVERLRLEPQLQEMTRRHAVERQELANRQAAELAPLEERASHLDDTLHDMVTHHRAALFLPGKRSFAVFGAIISLRKVSARVTVLDSKAIMARARQLGVVRKIATPVRTYKFNLTMFKAFFAQCDEHRPQFEPYIDEVPEHDSLSIRPNDQHETIYDGKRLTNEPITIHPSSPRA